MQISPAGVDIVMCAAGSNADDKHDLIVIIYVIGGRYSLNNMDLADLDVSKGVCSVTGALTRAHLSEFLHVPVRQILELHSTRVHLCSYPLDFFGISEEQLKS